MKPMTLCKFDFNDLPIKYHSQYPFSRKDLFVYLGDITNMSEHCVVVRTSDNVVFSCYHTENFIEYDNTIEIKIDEEDLK